MDKTEPPRSSRRGVLCLVDGELSNYEYDIRVLQESTSAMRKRRRRKESAMALKLEQQQRSIAYNPSHSEWTLFFFGSSSNLNCLRFRPLLAEFCQNHPDKVQCICVPNGIDEDLLPLGTGFYHLPWDHSNRSALLHLLAVTRIPTLVVVSNHDGRRITDRGIAAIESSSASNPTAAAPIFERWRQQGKGYGQQSLSLESCIVS